MRLHNPKRIDFDHGSFSLPKSSVTSVIFNSLSFYFTKRNERKKFYTYNYHKVRPDGTIRDKDLNVENSHVHGAVPLFNRQVTGIFGCVKWDSIKP